MKSYDNFLRMTSESQPQIVFIVTLATGILVTLMLLGGWLPLFCQKQASPADLPSRRNRPEPVNMAALLPLLVGGGIAIMVMFGTLSAFLFKDLTAGIVSSVVIGMASTVQLLKQLRGRRKQFGNSKRIFIFATLCAMSLTVWQHFVSELEFNNGSETSLAYSDMNDDTSFHVHLAIMLREHGLPLRDVYGSPDNRYCAVTHTGHGVLIGSFASMFRVSEFHAAAGLWVTASVLLCWSALAVTESTGLSGFYQFVVGLTPILIGPLLVPSLLPTIQPDAALAIAPGVAGLMYANITQALSTAVAGVSLVVFAKYCTSTDADAPQLRLITLTGTMIVVAGWIKPSIFIFYAPALIVTLLVQRRNIKELLAAMAVFVAGCTIYFLPTILVRVPDVPSWSLHPSADQSVEVAKFVGLGCGAALLMVTVPLWRFSLELLKPAAPRPVTLPLIAMGGSLTFALLFREERFVGYSAFQPNIWWGPAACVILLLPLLIQNAVIDGRSSQTARWIQWAATLMLIIQLINGAQYAFAAPAVNHRAFPGAHASAMEEARRQTDSSTRFLLDPVMAWVDIAAFLRRPALYRTSYMFTQDRENLDEWNRLFDSNEPTADAGWKRYDAAILTDSAPYVGRILSDHDWESRPLTDGYILYLNPNRNAVDPEDVSTGETRADGASR